MDHAEQAMAAVGGDPPGRDLFPTLPICLARAHLESGDATRARAVLQRADVMDLPRHERGRLFAGVALAGVLAKRCDDAAVALLEEVSESRAGAAVPPGDGARSDRWPGSFRSGNAARGAMRARGGRRPHRWRAPRHAGAGHHDRELVERGMLRALGAVPRDVAAAERLFAECLAVAQPEHFIRTIVDHGPAVSQLLSSATPERGLAGYVEDLIVVTTAAPTPPRPLVAAPLVDPLSARELTVLRYLTSRLTNEEIAAALYVSLNTLKTHVKSIYRKLAVGSRREAVDTGRQLRLI